MEYDINVKISNRHVHLTKDTYEKLFAEEISVKNNLNQIGEFASNQVVTIRVNDKTIENVRVVGPFRNYNQVEISKRDARVLNVFPPVRRSGDLEDSLDVIIETPKGSVKTNGLIISNRHVHINTKDKEKFGVEDKQIVKIEIPGPKKGMIEAEVKISDNGFYELHIDTDDGNAFLLENDDKLKMIV